jgi:hypothetical protein
VAAAFGVSDQFSHSLSGRGALNRHSKRNFVKCSARPFETKLVGDVEAASNVNLGILNRYII